MTATLYETSVVNASVAPTVRTAAATTTGATVDLGQRALGFRSALFVAVSGDVTDGSFTVALEHSDDGSSWVAVPAGRLQGAFTAITTSAAVQIVGYTAAKRYVRAKLTLAGATDGGTVGVLVVAGGANQPVGNG